MKKLLIVDCPEGGIFAETIGISFNDEPDHYCGIGYTEITPPTEEEMEKAKLQSIHDAPLYSEGKYVKDAISIYNDWLLKRLGL